jgi:hypothetical protein
MGLGAVALDGMVWTSSVCLRLLNGVRIGRRSALERLPFVFVKNRYPVLKCYGGRLVGCQEKSSFVSVGSRYGFGVWDGITFCFGPESALGCEPFRSEFGWVDGWYFVVVSDTRHAADWWSRHGIFLLLVIESRKQSDPLCRLPYHLLPCFFPRPHLWHQENYNGC